MHRGSDYCWLTRVFFIFYFICSTHIKYSTLHFLNSFSDLWILEKTRSDLGKKIKHFYDIQIRKVTADDYLE